MNQIIAAAQLFTHLGANCSLPKPERESQLRPLIGQSPEQAAAAWAKAQPVALHHHRRLEALKGDRAGQLSLRINDQDRLCFRWQDDRGRT